MRTRPIALGIVLTLMLVAFALALTTCGGRKRAMNPPSIGSNSPAQHRVAPPIQAAGSLDKALMELEGMECPEGVDEELWEKLTDALASQLESRFSNRDSLAGNSRLESRDSRFGGKFVSTPPTGEENKVTDLAITDNGDGTYTLSWHYRNLGDYDQNGTVGILDIMPIATHYGESYDMEDVDCLLAVIDGSGNGIVDIADITPIVVNYGVKCAGYAIGGGDWTGVPINFVQEAPLNDAIGDGRLEFTGELDVLLWDYYFVVPYDSERNSGIVSNTAELPRKPEPPTNLQASDGTYTDRIEITWTASIGADSYLLYRATSEDGAYSLLASPSGTSYEDDPGDTNTYWYKAKAHNDIGDSDYSTADDGYKQGWHTMTPDSANEVGGYTSLVVVDGNPAISYYDSAIGDLKYVRASDAGGGSWGSPIVVDSEGDVGRGTSLAVVNGNPAISYCDWTNRKLKYVRATDASGSAWGTPIVVDSVGQVERYNSLAVVNGNPAISYYVNDDLKYVRASDASGGSWGSPIVVRSAGDVGRYASLAVVNGNPAISYRDGGLNDDLKYVRANYADGSWWGTPVTIDSSGNVGHDISLCVVNGNPAISYYDSTNDDLKYVRASDASGGNWRGPIVVDSEGDVGRDTSLAIVNGNPAISYLDGTNEDLKYVRATDAGGSAWGTPHIVDSAGQVGRYNSLAVVNGNPAISYYDSTNGDLKFAIYY